MSTDKCGSTLKSDFVKISPFLFISSALCMYMHAESDLLTPGPKISASASYFCVCAELRKCKPDSILVCHQQNGLNSSQLHWRKRECTGVTEGINGRQWGCTSVVYGPMRPADPFYW